MASGQHSAGTAYQLPTSWGPFEHVKSGGKARGKCGALFFAGQHGHARGSALGEPSWVTSP